MAQLGSIHGPLPEAGQGSARAREGGGPCEVGSGSTCPGPSQGCTLPSSLHVCKQKWSAQATTLQTMDVPAPQLMTLRKSPTDPVSLHLWLRFQSLGRCIRLAAGDLGKQGS